MTATITIDFSSDFSAAAGYRREAGRYYDRSAAAARRAAGWYKLAAGKREHAAWLTARPDLWAEDPAFVPALHEHTAAVFTRVADRYLRSAFRNMDQARHANERAAYHAARHAGLTRKDPA